MMNRWLAAILAVMDVPYPSANVEKVELVVFGAMLQVKELVGEFYGEVVKFFWHDGF